MVDGAAGAPRYFFGSTPSSPPTLVSRPSWNLRPREKVINNPDTAYQQPSRYSDGRLSALHVVMFRRESRYFSHPPIAKIVDIICETKCIRSSATDLLSNEGGKTSKTFPPKGEKARMLPLKTCSTKPLTERLLCKVNMKENQSFMQLLQDENF